MQFFTIDPQAVKYTSAGGNVGLTKAMADFMNKLSNDEADQHQNEEITTSQRENASNTLSLSREI